MKTEHNPNDPVFWIDNGEIRKSTKRDYVDLNAESFTTPYGNSPKYQALGKTVVSWRQGGRKTKAQELGSETEAEALALDWNIEKTLKSTPPLSVAERIEIVIEEIENANVEYVESHEDYGSDIMDSLLADSWRGPTLEDLEKWIRSIGIEDFPGDPFLREIRNSIYLWEAKPSHIFASVSDEVFVAVHWRVEEVETQIEKSMVCELAQVSRSDLEKYLASDQREFCIPRNDPKSEVFETYATSDTVWRIQTTKEAVLEFWEEWKEEN